MVKQQRLLLHLIVLLKVMGPTPRPAALGMNAAQGSTCAMVESVLRHAGYRTGLYTSPHLVDVRERIRLDGWGCTIIIIQQQACTAPHSVTCPQPCSISLVPTQVTFPGRRRPVSKQLFLEHFWWCHSRLADKADAEYGMAAYFRFLTLVGAHALKNAL